MRPSIGIIFVTKLITTILGNRLEKRDRPQYVCSGLYGPVSDVGYEIATSRILLDGSSQFDIPVQWGFHATHPRVELECGKQWSEAGCLIVMNCRQPVRVSFREIHRVCREMSRCAYRGEGGIGLLTSDEPHSTNDINWWVTISRPGPPPAENVAALVSTILLLRQGSPRHGIPRMTVSSNSWDPVAVMPPMFDRLATTAAVILADAEIRQGVTATHTLTVGSEPMQVDWLDCAARIIEAEMEAGNAIPDCVQQ